MSVPSIRALASADASCGAKAAALARLIAAGLPVPDGFAIDSAAFDQITGLGDAHAMPGDAGDATGPGAGHVDAIGHALAGAAQRIAEAAPGALGGELLARARLLGRLAVRSSASLEDGALGAAAGVFASVTDVAPDALWDAVRAVWTSALTPLAVAYARRRAAARDLAGPGERTASIAMAVIVQRFVPGARRTIYTRPLGVPDGDELWLSRDDAGVERIARSRAASHPQAALALAAEAAIGATAGADVELVIADDGAIWIVQARPIVHPVRSAPHVAPPPFVLAPLVADGRRWTWDITHNPDPLSPAQAGLVDRVDRAGVTPYAMRVCGGYLYTTPREPGAPVPAPADRAELVARIAAIEARFVLDEPPSVALAVEQYVAFMAIWAGELSPLIAAARRKLPERLARDGHPPERIPGMVGALIGPVALLRDPVMAPAWDVAVPTFAERGMAASSEGREANSAPGALPPDSPAAADQTGAPPGALAPDQTCAHPRALAPDLADDVALARAAAEAAEADDRWFARAQWMVRRAMLAHASAHELRGDDVFWLPLDDVITVRTVQESPSDRCAVADLERTATPTTLPGSALNGSASHDAQASGTGRSRLDPDEAHRRASAARAASARAAAWDMPRIVHGSDPGHVPLPPRPGETAMLRGVGLGPTVVGRVVRFAALAGARRVGRGDVVVARAITPALAMLVDGCAALVSETGGLLDHGAALARELGITCVVGCAGAWTQLSDGAIVSVDGDAGLVGLVP